MLYRFVDTREGPALALVPPDVVEALRREAATPDQAERVLDLAALILVRAGAEAGALLLGHLLAHGPGYIVDADPQLAAALATEPELVVGDLVGP